MSPEALEALRLWGELKRGVAEAADRLRSWQSETEKCGLQLREFEREHADKLAEAVAELRKFAEEPSTKHVPLTFDDDDTEHTLYGLGPQPHRVEDAESDRPSPWAGPEGDQGTSQQPEGKTEQ